MTNTSFENKIAHFVREFFANHPEVKLVAVTGSAGKTSAKTAIATVLSQRYAVAMHEAEPRSRLQTLLQIMGVRYPDAPEEKWGWLVRRRLLKAVKKRARAEHPEAQVIVQEFSPQDIGYHAWFQSILSPDIAVITSVTTGRMHVEHPVEAVAQEMITLANIAKFAIINRDDIDGRFAAFLTNPQMTTYGSSEIAEYYYDEQDFSLQSGHYGLMRSPEHPEGIVVRLSLIGEHNVRPAIAAMTVAVRMGFSAEEVVRGLERLTSLPGRMQLLRGADATLLLDDSYSASPLTVASALQTLYGLPSPQKIAVLGNINGLRLQAPEEMARLGAMCDPTQLDWVVTVGEKANQYLAPAARQKGCQVKECRNALEAGAFVRKQLQADGIALFKGSSGGVWLEEAIKINLYSTADEQKLVRQSPAWLERKRQFFSHFSD
ncbi:MAG: Mur ligase family protein [Candidatus Saccharibacteria bacterium]|nr:Mur ligase family protein [Candidatus Saccharibacteria bacterium]